MSVNWKTGTGGGLIILDDPHGTYVNPPYQLVDSWVQANANAKGIPVEILLGSSPGGSSPGGIVLDLYSERIDAMQSRLLVDIATIRPREVWCEHTGEFVDARRHAREAGRLSGDRRRCGDCHVDTRAWCGAHDP